MESDKHSEEAVDAMALRPLLTPGKRHPELMGCKRNAMHHSPKYKIPRSAMPQAAQEHGNDEIGILANFPLPVASQRNIKVIAQPAGKRNMPPPPKFRNGSGLIRRIEIDIEMEAQQQGNADSHITVTGEVAINLQGIAINTYQILHPRIKSRIIKNTLYKVNADIVRYNRFLEEPTHDEEDSTSEHLIGDKQRAADLRNEITGTYNRTRHQLGKERNIKSIIQQTGQRRYLATVHIYRIAQRLKSEKRDAHRKENIHCRERASRQRGKSFAQKIGVLEVTQQSQIDEQTQHNPCLT